MVINPDGTVQFEGDVGKLMRGAGAATDQGALAAQNRAARLAKYGTEGVAKMEAAGTRFGGAASGAPASAPAAPSVATPTNPAPVATSQAASGTTFGQRALRSLRGSSLPARIARGVGVGAFLTAAPFAAMKTAETSTEDYEKQLSGLGVTPGQRYDSDALQLVRDIGVRGVGSLVDLGRAVNPFSGLGARAAAPAASGLTSANAAPTRSAIDAEGLLRGTGVPESGTGAFRVGRRPAVAVDTRGSVVPTAASVASNAVAPTVLPTLGTQGGIFQNLSKFNAEVGAQRGAAAASGRETKRAVRATELGLKESDAASRSVAALGTLLRGQAAVANAGDAGKKVTTDLMGNPVIVNTKAGTALAPTVKKPVSEADIAATMKANKMSREAVLARLRAEGRMD